MFAVPRGWIPPTRGWETLSTSVFKGLKWNLVFGFMICCFYILNYKMWDQFTKLYVFLVWAGWQWTVQPHSRCFIFQTGTFDPRTSLMLVGWSSGVEDGSSSSLVYIILMCSWCLRVKVFFWPVSCFTSTPALPESALISPEVGRLLRVVCFSVYFTPMTSDIRPVQGGWEVVLELEGLKRGHGELDELQVKVQIPHNQLKEQFTERNHVFGLEHFHLWR